MGLELNRIEPQGTPNLYTSFQVVAPLSTHFRPAKSCEEVACQNYLNGWQMILDPSTTEGQFYLNIFKENSAKFNYSRENLPDGRIKFTFFPGQNCFKLSQHKVRIERPERHFIRSGDYRSLGTPRELRADQWQEEFAENQDKLNTIIERG